MSVRHLALVADLLDVPPTSKLMLFAMAANADSRGWTTIGNGPLRKATGLSERTVRDTLKKLREDGYIERTSGSLAKLKIPA
jgi:DNA-binding Lrp family transcriptional regulator